jgi:hypothetical protein
MATEHSISIFQDSYQRCLSHPRFFEMFYDEFLGSHEDVQAKFVGVDMTRQMRMLRASMQMVMLASQDGIDPAYYLSSVGARHARTDLDIPPPLYDIWLEALVTTASLADPKFDAELRTAWIDVMTPGILYMRECY